MLLKFGMAFVILYFRILKMRQTTPHTDLPHEPVPEILFTPKQVAQRLNISVETLRLYEREGLILPFKLESGHRRFTEGDIDWIECIQKQIHTNKLNFAGIRYLLSMLPCWDIKPCCIEDYNSCPAGSKSCQPCWNFAETPCRKRNENCRACAVYQQVMNVDKLKEVLAVKFKCD